MGWKRREERWRTRFGAFVGRYTVAGIVAELGARGVGVSEKAVYDWVSGDNVPRPERARVLVQLSRGRLTLEHVYRHREEVRGNAERDRAASGCGPSLVAGGAAEGDRRH